VPPEPIGGTGPSPAKPASSRAFAPGRVNLIGEHTDYNRGLALPFAIAEGITVSAVAPPPGTADDGRVRAYARDLDERDEFPLAEPEPASGWRAFVRGTVAELMRAEVPLVGASLEIGGGPPRGAGLSSSAALEVALCLALIELATRADAARSRGGEGSVDGGGSVYGKGPELQPIDIAKLCARVENDWVGAQTGLLDQLASLCGAPDTALCIDFDTLHIQPVPLLLGDWRLVVLDSHERHVHASSGYNQRRAECAQACRLLDIDSLRDAAPGDLERLPEPLRRRARHVLDENRRVRDAVDALRARDLPAVGRLLDASHRSLRENYEISTAAVEATVQRLRDAGASGARLIGGGFGGSVLGLFAPGAAPPADAREVHPGRGAHLLGPYDP
jgi:galactokinase